MKFVTRTKQPATHAIAWCILLVIIYTVLIFALPANSITQQKYDLTSFEYRLIMFSLAVPSLLLWFAAFIGYGTLRQYAHALRHTDEGADFLRLSQGCTWLVWSLPISAILAIVFNALANTHPHLHPTAIILQNYASLIFPLIGFTIICLSSHRLLARLKLELRLRNIRLMTVLFIGFGLIYCYLTFQHLDLSSLSSSSNPYYLPLWLLIITIILPFLYTWFIGLIGAAQIALFSRNAVGLLYRRALIYLAIGLVAVIVSSIALQYVNAVIPRVGHLRLDYRLILSIVFRIIGALGFILITIGAHRLKKIEEV